LTISQVVTGWLSWLLLVASVGQFIAISALVVAHHLDGPLRSRLWRAAFRSSRDIDPTCVVRRRQVLASAMALIAIAVVVNGIVRFLSA
jgi:PhoPQ-activated pathogenicity-related protein